MPALHAIYRVFFYGDAYMRVCVPMDFKADALNLVVVGVGLGLADCTSHGVFSLFNLSLITLIARSAQSQSVSQSTIYYSSHWKSRTLLHIRKPTKALHCYGTNTQGYIHN